MISEEHRKKISDSLKKAYAEKRRTGFIKGQPSPRKGIKTPGWTNQASFKEGHPAPATAFKKNDPRLVGSKINIGRVPWNKGIKGDGIRGEKHWNWKGGKPKTNRRETMTYEEHRRYLDWQKAVFKRDGWNCQSCGKHGGVLHADHIKSWVDHPELRYELSNGRALCPPCHRKTPTYGRKRQLV